MSHELLSEGSWVNGSPCETNTTTGSPKKIRKLRKQNRRTRAEFYFESNAQRFPSLCCRDTHSRTNTRRRPGLSTSRATHLLAPARKISVYRRGLGQWGFSRCSSYFVILEVSKIIEQRLGATVSSSRAWVYNTRT